MPRHRFHHMHRKPRAPKPPKPPKAHKPAVGDLKRLYRDLLTPDIGARINTLALALAWYDQKAVPFCMSGGTYTTEQAKNIDVAVKCRLLGMSPAAGNPERENAFRKAIRRYELVCTTLNPPALDVYYKDLDANAARLEDRQKRLEEKYGQIADHLTKALQPRGITGQAITIGVGQIKNEHQIDPERSQLTLRRDVARELRHKLRREGFLPAVVSILPQLSKLAALRQEYDAVGQPTGKWVAAKGDMLELQNQMLANLIAFGRTPEAPKRWVRQIVPGVHVPANGKTRVHTGGNFGKRGGSKVANAFMAGTTIAGLFQLVADGQWHTYEDMKVIAGRWPLSTLISKMRWIDGVGRKQASLNPAEGWQIEFDGTDKFRIVYTTPAYMSAVQASIPASAHP